METSIPSGHAIGFQPVSPIQSEQVPGGMVQGKVICPWFDDPIGWIILGPGIIPPGCRRRKPPSDVWSFLPTCSIEPTLSAFSSLRTLLAAVRKQYRRMYDRTPCAQRKLFAKGDEYEIESLLSIRCGLNEVWDENHLDEDYSFMRDVVPDCGSAYDVSRTWEDGGAGLSDVIYYVYSDNPSRFIREVRKITEKLLAEKKAKPQPPPPIPKRSRATIRKERMLKDNLTFSLDCDESPTDQHREA